MQDWDCKEGDRKPPNQNRQSAPPSPLDDWPTPKGLNGASQSIEGQAVGIDMHGLTLENTIIPLHESQKVSAISMRGESTSVLVFLWL